MTAPMFEMESPADRAAREANAVIERLQARAEQERGLSLARRGVDPAWRRWAEQLVRARAATRQEFIFADLYDDGLPLAPSSSWAGVVMHGMAKAGVVEMVGAEPSPLKTTKSALVRVWRGR